MVLLVLGLLSALLPAACHVTKPGSAFGSKPHLVFLLQDDLGHFDVAFNGNSAAAMVTANITKLATEGIILRSHYVHWHCSPTRRSFLSGRLPVHHHEQLSGTATDDLDLRYTWISAKLKQAGYATAWMGKGHTGYKSMHHLPTANGFDHFLGFLGGSQSYTANDRWEDDHPLRTDADFVNPPRSCVPGSGGAGAAAAASSDGGTKPKCGIILRHDSSFTSSSPPTVATAVSAGACCALCEQAQKNCSHWTFSPSFTTRVDGNNSGGDSCTMWRGSCTAVHTPGSTSGVMFHPAQPPSPPHPQPTQHNDSKCHANSYSTTLYGEGCLQTIRAHNVSIPLFLYFPIQAVHTPYDAVPFNPTRSTYQGMLWDSDVYIGAITNLLKAKAMYAETLIVYSADVGAVRSGCCLSVLPFRCFLQTLILCIALLNCHITTERWPWIGPKLAFARRKAYKLARWTQGRGVHQRRPHPRKAPWIFFRCQLSHCRELTFAPARPLFVLFFLFYMFCLCCFRHIPAKFLCPLTTIL